ncbi:hypothetical protein EK21DRAFT_78689 [Setomelanomma holmii]|uniref:C2H2-type domain-containing protein n=1 Tax=Setomelanomma holmii TaxID=210430 RepID=A0A9P4GZJ2_9PLEO|nr:hypothetical protein EK21DRAFT_78689 [Setomelanomma holmii]
MEAKSRVFPCNTCSITFTTSEPQRSHMRQSWHITNLRRRIAEQPALSEEEYNSQARSHDFSPRCSDSDEEREPRMPVPIIAIQPTDDIPIAPHRPAGKGPASQCLFCNIVSSTLNTNVDHMSAKHGLFIPSPERLSDMCSFLGYLAMIIFDYKQCLYCGIQKSSVDGVQTHMRDKGHCMINVSAESELLDFWAISDSEGEVADLKEKVAAVKFSDTEMRLPSGTVINSRSDTTQLRTTPGVAQPRSKSSQHQSKRDEMRAIAAAEGNAETTRNYERQYQPLHSNDRRIAVRSEMGLAGVPEDQKRALVVTEKNMKRREAVAQAATQRAMERQPKTKIYSGRYKLQNPVYMAG